MHAMGIDDAYRVQRVLVRNSNGVTELVTIEDAGPFVRKKMPSGHANRSVWAALAGNECSRLPQVAATYEMPDHFVAVYDYVPGETLEDAIGRSGSLDVQTAVQIARDVCEALAALHERGIVHLDVSPANVLIAADGAHLLDFGNARIIASGGARDGGRGRPKGTWGFAAPEQFFRKADARSDVFAVGRLLGYMMTGLHPDEDHIVEFDAAVQDESRVPTALRAVIERATDFEPSVRYQSVDELAAALNGADCKKASERDARVRGTLSEREADSAARQERFVRQSDAGHGPSGFSKTSHASKSFSRAIRIATVVLACAAAFMSVVVGVKVLASRSDDDLPATTVSGGQDSSKDEDEAGSGSAVGSSAFSMPSEAQLARARESLKVVESGWDASSGYVLYALTLENTSDDLIIDYPEILITGRDQDGSVLFANPQVLGVIYPGERLTFAFQAGNGKKPVTVEFAPAALQDYQVSVGTGKATKFEVADLTARSGSYGSTFFTGEVTTVFDGDESTTTGEVWVSLILRDEGGKIVYAKFDLCKRPRVGESTAFEIEAYNCPAYATAEAVGMAW